MIGVMNIDIATINKSKYMWRTIFVLILDRGSFRSSDWLINVKCQIKSPLLLLLQCIMHNVYAWGGGVNLILPHSGSQNRAKLG